MGRFHRSSILQKIKTEMSKKKVVAKEKKVAFKEVIIDAVFNIKDRKGASAPAIKKYIAANHQEVKYVSAYRTAVKKLVDRGELVRDGARFRLNPEKRKAIIKAKKDALKPKKT